MRQRTFNSSKGKLVDTWYYTYKGVEEHQGFPPSEKVPYDPEDPDNKEGREAENANVRKMVRDQKVEIRVYLDKTTEETDKPPHSLREVQFVAKCETPYILVSGTDIEAIRKTVWSQLDDTFEIKWETYYRVEIIRSRYHSGIGEGFNLEYDDIEKGTAHDGTLLMREYKYHQGYKISPWPGEFKDERGDVMACIPATDKNRDALGEFCKRLNKMRELLAETIKPEQIMNTLQNLGQLALLPPADEKQPVARKRGD
jgi:hypothetical protein